MPTEDTTGNQSQPPAGDQPPTLATPPDSVSASILSSPPSDLAGLAAVGSDPKDEIAVHEAYGETIRQRTEALEKRVVPVMQKVSPDRLDQIIHHTTSQESQLVHAAAAALGGQISMDLHGEDPYGYESFIVRKEVLVTSYSTPQVEFPMDTTSPTYWEDRKEAFNNSRPPGTTSDAILVLTNGDEDTKISEVRIRVHASDAYPPDNNMGYMTIDWREGDTIYQLKRVTGNFPDQDIKPGMGLQSIVSSSHPDAITSWEKGATGQELVLTDAQPMAKTQSAIDTWKAITAALVNGVDPANDNKPGVLKADSDVTQRAFTSLMEQRASKGITPTPLNLVN